MFSEGRRDVFKGCTENEWAKLTKYNPGNLFANKVSQGRSSSYLSEGITVRILIRILLTDKNIYTYLNEEVNSNNEGKLVTDAVMGACLWKYGKLIVYTLKDSSILF